MKNKQYKICPSCGRMMFIRVNLLNTMYYQCNECGFEDEITKEVSL